jgi:hypothetical protein
VYIEGGRSALAGLLGPGPRVRVGCLDGTRGLFFLGGVSFHFLKVAMCPKTNSVLCCRRHCAPEPSGSWNANEREEEEPGAYELGLWTHEGFWVMMRDVYVGFSAASALCTALGEEAFEVSVT